VQTNYPGFLKNFYSKFPEWKDLTYKGIKDLWDKELFGTANFYSKNIRQYSWQASEVIINDENMQQKWAKEHNYKIRINEISLLRRLPESIKNLLGLRGWMKQILLAQIRVYRPDVIYMHDLSVLNTDDLKVIKKQVKLVAGQIACPLPLDRKPLYEYDLIVSSFPHYVIMFKDWGINSEYLKWCIEADIPKIVGPRKRTFGAVFIGGLIPAHGQGNRVLEKLVSKVKVDIWGYGENTLPPLSPIRKNFHGQAWGKEMYEIFAAAKIVVNRHINVAGNVANNMRMFEATGMGAMLITDDKPNMKEFFDVGREAITYKNAEELVEKIGYYLTHDREREVIAIKGQRKTLTRHTYKQRMKDLDLILRKYL